MADTPSEGSNDIPFHAQHERFALKRYLVTGGNGFIGRHLIRDLLSKGASVTAGTYGDSSSLDFAKGDADLFNLDLADSGSLAEKLTTKDIDYVIHLAAQSSIPRSWSHPKETLETNVLGTFGVLEALKISRFGGRAVLVGAGAEYGPMSTMDQAVSEATPFKPTSIYGVSKVAVDMLGLFYSNSLGYDIVRVRPFNITGPGKVGDACSDFARSIAIAERGKESTLKVGNLSTIRDYLDVRDAVAGISAVLEHGVKGDCYNICSGKGYRIEVLLDTLLSFSSVKLKIEVDSSKMRPVDEPVDIGDNTKLRNLGWKQSYAIEKTLGDILKYWREETAKGEY